METASYSGGGWWGKSGELLRCDCGDEANCKHVVILPEMSAEVNGGGKGTKRRAVPERSVSKDAPSRAAASDRAGDGAVSKKQCPTLKPADVERREQICQWFNFFLAWKDATNTGFARHLADSHLDFEHVNNELKELKAMVLANNKAVADLGALALSLNAEKTVQNKISNIRTRLRKLEKTVTGTEPPPDSDAPLPTAVGATVVPLPPPLKAPAEESFLPEGMSLDDASSPLSQAHGFFPRNLIADFNE